MTFLISLLITILFASLSEQDNSGNWITHCQSSDKDLTDVCLNEFSQWITIFRKNPMVSNTQHLQSRQTICPKSNLWKSLVICACDKCHDTFFLPSDLEAIWTKSECNMKNINATVDLCQWIKTATFENSSHHHNISSKQMTLQDLKQKMSAIIVNAHRYKSVPTIQNIEEFLHLFKQIIDGIIYLHITSTKPQVLKKWERNVTDTFETFKNAESKIKSEETVLLNALNTVESKEIEMIEDLQILQQLENHFNIPRAQAQTQEIFKKFKALVSGVQEIHDKHTSKHIDSKQMEVFWNKGLSKLRMAANILSVISNETESINQKLDQHQLSLNSVKNIASKIDNDLHNDQHELLLQESKKFHQIIQEMRDISKSQSYQHAITTMEELSKEWQLATKRTIRRIEMIESKITDLLHNTSKTFKLDDGGFFESETHVDIDGIFKQVWQQEMKSRHIERTKMSLEYDDASIDETLDHRSGSTDIMTNKIFIYGWTAFVGAVLICFSFFMYFK